MGARSNVPGGVICMACGSIPAEFEICIYELQEPKPPLGQSCPGEGHRKARWGQSFVCAGCLPFKKIKYAISK